MGQVQLLVVEAPVQAGQGALLVDLGLDVGQLEADSAVGLLADEGDVPLFAGGETVSRGSPAPVSR